jgi:hypothetical protein
MPLIRPRVRERRKPDDRNPPIGATARQVGVSKGAHWSRPIVTSSLDCAVGNRPTGRWDKDGFKRRNAVECGKKYNYVAFKQQSEKAPAGLDYPMQNTDLSAPIQHNLLINIIFSMRNVFVGT